MAEYTDDPNVIAAVDDVRRILVLASLVAVGAHREALGEEGDFWEGSGHNKSMYLSILGIV